MSLDFFATNEPRIGSGKAVHNYGVLVKPIDLNDVTYARFPLILFLLLTGINGLPLTLFVLLMTRINGLPPKHYMKGHSRHNSSLIGRKKISSEI